jgi:hypothetical protein
VSPIATFPCSPLSPAQPRSSGCTITPLPLSGEFFFMNTLREKCATCLKCMYPRLLTLVTLARGTRTPHPSPSAGDTQRKTSQACIRVMSSPSGPRTCAQSQKYKVSKRQLNVPYIPRTPNLGSRTNNGNGRKENRSAGTHTLSSFDPSWFTRVRLPTISVGNTRSSRIFSWTSVRVRLRGRFCLTRDVRVGLRRIRRWATKTTWRSENFFSSSRVSLEYVWEDATKL